MFRSVIGKLTLFSFIFIAALLFTLLTISITLANTGGGGGRLDKVPAFSPSKKDLLLLGQAIIVTTQAHLFSFAVCFVVVYTFLQSFAVPGSAFAATLCGALFPTPLALLLISLSTTVGASCCYFLSNYFAGPILDRYFAAKMKDFKEKTMAYSQQHLLNYMISARISPIFPNWFISIASPHVGIPWKVFSMGTFIGVAPLGFICIRAGKTLRAAGDLQEFQWWSWENLALLIFAVLVAFLPKITQLLSYDALALKVQPTLKGVRNNVELRRLSMLQINDKSERFEG